MNKRRLWITEYWYQALPGALLAVQAAVFLIFRQESYPQVHDNLDLFVAHYEMIKQGGAFFAQNVSMPMLHGIDRDLLGSEFNLYNLMYVLLPGFYAYLAGYALKIITAFVSLCLLAREYLQARYEWCKPLVVVTACAYALIPVFPAYGIAFTSLPLLMFYLLRLHRIKSRRELVLLCIGIFCYPFLSYFAYHGFFLLCYMALAIVLMWIVKKAFPVRMFAATALLSLGYMAFEYRLFRAMLFSNTVTIRAAMEMGNVTFKEALLHGLHEFVNPSFHAQDSRTYFVLPVVLLGAVWINAMHIRNHEAGKIIRDPVNCLLAWIVLNCGNYGLALYAPYRTLLETIVPKLKGFEFSRTSYLNPFLMYAAFLLVLVRMMSHARFHVADGARQKRIRRAAAFSSAAALLIVTFMPQMYNDFYYTCYNQAYRILKQKETTYVNYREFYSATLFDEVKAGIDYKGEWSCAYGLHPSVLNYNGIATLDGYLGMYPLSYKEAWDEVIAPAKEGSPSLASYFENWGARVWLMSASDENTYAPLRNLTLQDERLVADTEALKNLECTYIFSRIRFSNEEEAGVELTGTYEGHDSPYVIHVYRLKEDLSLEGQPQAADEAFSAAGGVEV